MQMPPADPDTLFEDLLQDLPPETTVMARECTAFVRATKVKPPQQLLRVVFLYCGLDKSLPETATDFTLLYAAITDSSIAEHLAACRPWMQAVWAKMLPTNMVATLPAPYRFLVIDGSHVQGPGAQGPQYRLRLCMDLVQFQCVAITLTDQPTGESLVHFPWGPGDIALADRGYTSAPPIVETVKKQAEVLLRMSPAHLPVYRSDGQRIALMQVLRAPPGETHHTIDVCGQAPASRGEVRGYMHAYRLSEEQANVARQRLRAQSRKKGRTPKDPPRFWAGAEVWLLGKRRYAVVERRAHRRLGDNWSRLDGERRGTLGRVWKLTKDEVGVHILGVTAWREEGWAASLKVIMERPRRRKLPGLPDDVIDVYHCLPTSDQDELREAA